MVFHSSPRLDVNTEDMCANVCSPFALGESPNRPKQSRVPSFEHVISKLRPIVANRVHSFHLPHYTHGTGNSRNVHPFTTVEWEAEAPTHLSTGTGGKEDDISPLRSTFFIADRKVRRASGGASKQKLGANSTSGRGGSRRASFAIHHAISPVSAYFLGSSKRTIHLEKMESETEVVYNIRAPEVEMKGSTDSAIRHSKTKLGITSRLLKPAMQSCLKNSYRLSLPFTPHEGGHNGSALEIQAAPLPYPSPSIVFPSTKEAASIAQYARQLASEEDNRRASDPDVQSEFERELFHWVDKELRAATRNVEHMAEMKAGFEGGCHESDDEGGYCTDLDASPCLGYEQYRKGGSIYSRQYRKAKQNRKTDSSKDRARGLGIGVGFGAGDDDMVGAAPFKDEVDNDRLTVPVLKAPRFCLHTEIVPRVGSPSHELLEAEQEQLGERREGSPSSRIPSKASTKLLKKRQDSIIVLPGEDLPEVAFADRSNSHAHSGTTASNLRRITTVSVGPATPFNYSLHAEQQLLQHAAGKNDLQTKTAIFVDPLQMASSPLRRLRSRSAPEVSISPHPITEGEIEIRPPGSPTPCLRASSDNSSRDGSESRPDLATRRLSRFSIPRPSSLVLHDLPEPTAWATVEIEVNGARLHGRNMDAPAVWDPRVAGSKEIRQEKQDQESDRDAEKGGLKLPDRNARRVKSSFSHSSSRAKTISDCGSAAIGLGIGNMETMSPIRGLNAPEYGRLASEVGESDRYSKHSSAAASSMQGLIPRYNLDETLRREMRKKGTSRGSSPLRLTRQRKQIIDSPIDAVGSLALPKEVDATLIEALAKAAATGESIKQRKKSEQMTAWAVSTFEATEGGAGEIHSKAPSPQSLVSVAFNSAASPSISRIATPIFTVDGVVLNERQMSQHILAAAHAAAAATASAMATSTPHEYKPTALRVATPGVVPAMKGRVPLFTTAVAMNSCAITSDSGGSAYIQPVQAVPTAQRERRSADFTRRESLVAQHVARKVGKSKKAATALTKRRARGPFDNDSEETDEAERSEGSKLEARKETLAQLTGESSFSFHDSKGGGNFFLTSPKLNGTGETAHDNEQSPAMRSPSLRCISAVRLEQRTPSRAGSTRGRGRDLATQVRVKELHKNSPLAPFLSRLGSHISTTSSSSGRDMLTQGLGMQRGDSVSSVASSAAMVREDSVASAVSATSSPMIRENSINSMGSFAGVRPAFAAHREGRRHLRRLAATHGEDSSSGSSAEEEAEEREEIRDPDPIAMRMPWQPAMGETDDDVYALQSISSKEGNLDMGMGLGLGRSTTDLRMVSTTPQTSHDSPLAIVSDSPLDRFTDGLRSDSSLAPHLMSSTLLTPSDVRLGGPGFEGVVAEQEFGRGVGGTRDGRDEWILRNVRERVQTPLDFFSF
ncbi:hypothetical protein K437DRAFT_271772 [Tilletiaria anomala UBC 951]|uniref:Uncharacterized protein n=1 Tax=Tilletiaria anomala (strain ATCC 24038 / CBS 436.72 / UBC 951) TaxID=1037660 RepID=A0A066WQG6_TILAU|nr:uncharacterized protein K437DRAFT_271772 [Tilletiaria anomala UBC 951]KDN53259.1 hypothetical protein K437DRAFT_271772 [Tilletiaria anomala UBC 951]